MQNKPFRLGPVALSATLTTDILNPPDTTGGIGTGTPGTFILLKHIRIVNKTAGSVPASLWLGASGANAAGTELMSALMVPANSHIDLYSPGIRLDVGDFLVGGAGAGTSLTLFAEGEIGIA